MPEPYETTTVTKILRSEVSFYGTIICTILSLAAIYFGLKSDIALLTQEVRFHTSQSDKIENQITALDVRVVATEKSIIILQNNK